MKKKVVLFLAFLSCFVCGGYTVEAAEEEGQDILFVVDGSYSMVSHDPQKQVYQAIETLAELSIASNNRIGYLLYNDSIILDSELQEVTSQEQVNSWLQELRGVHSVKGTDVGLALKTAQRMLVSGNAREHHQMIIVLTDGDTETDTTNPNRSQQAVNQDIQAVLSSTEAPVYVIQYSEVEYRNKEPMSQWGEETGGKNYTAQNVDELIAAVMDCYSTQQQLSMEQDSLLSEEQTNEIFSLTIPIKHTDTQRVKELIVTLQSEGMINQLTYDDTEDLSVQENGSQVMVKITNPQKETYVLTYQTETNQPVETTTFSKMEDIVVADKANTTYLWLYVLIGAVIIGGCIVMFFKLFKKQPQTTVEPVSPEEYFFGDSLEGCFIKTPDEEEIPIQNWQASIFQRQKSVTLYDLLWGESIKDKMPESKKVVFQVGKQNTLRMKLKGNVEGIQQGRAIPKGVWTTLSVRQGAYLIFQEDVLEIDIHIRKKSSKG